MFNEDKRKGRRPKSGKGHRYQRSIARDPEEIQAMGGVEPEEAYHFQGPFGSETEKIETRPKKESKAADALEMIYPRWSKQVALAESILDPEIQAARVETLKQVAFMTISPYLHPEELRRVKVSLFGDPDTNLASTIKTPRDLVGYITNFIAKARGQGVLPIGKKTDYPKVRPEKEEKPEREGPEPDYTPDPDAEFKKIKTKKMFPPKEPPMESINIDKISEQLRIVELSAGHMLVEDQADGEQFLLKLVGDDFLVVESDDGDLGKIKIEGIADRLRTNMVDKYDHSAVKKALARLI